MGTVGDGDIAGVWLRRGIAGAALLLCGAAAAGGGIVVDNTLVHGGKLGGPYYDINAGLGKQVGNNLFFSFSSFNLLKSETANFSGPDGLARIISRVTGGQASSIDGRLQSSVAGADFYFINPAGVMFGPNASVDVGGSFYVSSAHYLKLGDGGRFDAANPGASTLTSAAPEAFGFLGGQGGIKLVGAQLFTQPGTTLALVGGDITLNAAVVDAPGGHVVLASTQAADEVALGPSGIASGRPLSGSIALVNGSFAKADNTDMLGTGSIDVAGGSVALRSSYLDLENFSDFDGGDIRVNANGMLSIDGGGDCCFTGIYNDNFGAGRGGGIFVRAQTLRQSNFGWIAAQGFAAGSSGPVRADAADIFLSSGGQIFSQNFGSGGTGDVTVNASRSLLIDGGSDNTSSGIFLPNYGDGPSGTLRITAPQLVVSNGGIIASDNFGSARGSDLLIDTGDLAILRHGSIQTRTFGGGAGGDLVVNAAHSVLIDGYVDNAPGGSGNTASSLLQSLVQGQGRGGDVRISTPLLTLDHAGTISSAVFYGGGGSGDGGGIFIQAADVRLAGQGLIFASSFTDGRAGDVRIDASNRIDVAGVDRRSPLYNFNIDQGGIGSIAFNNGGGGDVSLTAPQISLSGFAQVVAETFGSQGGGSISISTHTLDMSSGADIDSNTCPGCTDPGNKGDAGNIRIDADQAVNMVGIENLGATSTVISTETYSSGRGGVITINTPQLNMDHASTISAAVFSSGDGGQVRINAADLRVDGNSAIYAAVFPPHNGAPPPTGNAGDIIINATHSMEMSQGNPDLGETQISTENFGSGRGGDITINTPALTMNTYTLINGDNLGSNPDGGSITLNVGDLDLGFTANITSSTGSPVLSGTGFGGGPDLFVNATRSVHLRTGAAMFTESLGQQAGVGKGGTMSIDTPLLLVDGESQLNARTTGPGLGGSIDIRADNVVIDGLVTAESTGAGDSGAITINTRDASINGTVTTQSSGDGRGGTITLNASHDVLLNFGQIITETTGSRGGDIHLSAGHLLYLLDSEVSTSVLSDRSDGDGGNIFINSDGLFAPGLVVLNRSAIFANAIAGNGGGIQIDASAFQQSTDSTVQAFSALRQDGTIVISSPIVDVGSGLGVLSASYLDARNLLRQGCAAGRSGSSNSFIVAGRGGFPQSSAQAIFSLPPLRAPGASAGMPPLLAALAPAPYGCLSLR